MGGSMRNIAMRLKYDGTAYHGWQRQQNAVRNMQTAQFVSQKHGKGKKH